MTLIHRLLSRLFRRRRVWGDLSDEQRMILAAIRRAK
jgi:hypothetical protein